MLRDVPVGRRDRRRHRQLSPAAPLGAHGLVVSQPSGGDPVTSTFETPRLDRALNKSWPSDAATTPDRAPVAVRAQVVWERAGEELIEARATRWSGRSVFVSPTVGRSRNGALGVWLDARDVSRRR
jgi:hypothetical protein